MQLQNMYPRDEERSSEQSYSIEQHFHHYDRNGEKIQPPQKFAALMRLSLILAILSLLDTTISGILLSWDLTDIGFFIGTLNTLVVNILFYYLLKTSTKNLRPEKVSIFLMTMFVSALLLIILPPKSSVEPGLILILMGLWVGTILLNVFTYIIARKTRIQRR